MPSIKSKKKTAKPKRKVTLNSNGPSSPPEVAQEVNAEVVQQEVLTASGEPIPSMYLKDGVSTEGFNPPPATQLWWYVVGGTGSGKTTMACSIPKCVVCSLERKTSGVRRLAPGSIVVGEPKFDPKTGRLISAAWTAEQYVKFWDLLVDEAYAGRKYFDMVAIDTVGGLCELALDWFTEQYQDAPSLQKSPGMDFTKYGAEGSGYKSMNGWIIRNMHRLRSAGYGGLIIGHRDFITKEVNGKNRVDVKYDCNPGVHRWLARKIEYAGIMEQVQKTQFREVTRTVKGKEKRFKEPMGHEWQYVLNIETQPDAGRAHNEFVRQHVPMAGEIELPEGYAWDAICTSYDEACASKRKAILEEGV